MQDTVRRPATRPQAEALALFTVLLIVDSFHYIFARLYLPYFHPATSAFYVLAVAAVELGLYALIRRQLAWRAARQHLWFFLSIGFLIAGATVLGFAGIAYIDPGTASMLAKTGVIINLLLGVFWLRERLSRTQMAGAAIAVAGALTISFRLDNVVQWGALLILASTLMYSLHTAIVKRWGGSMDFLMFFFYRVLFTAAFLFVFSVGSGNFTWPGPYPWLLLIVGGTVDVVISRALYYQTLRMLTMSVHTIILTVSPVVAVFFALFLFGTFPGTQELIGGALVLVGVATVTRG